MEVLGKIEISKAGNKSGGPDILSGPPQHPKTILV
jgi:hypothetical protein